MCGIVGFLNLDQSQSTSSWDEILKQDPQKVIRRMGKQFAHRGPDDCGYWVGNDLALGHQRLSIIDLSSAARNPMTNEEDSLVLVANGEIYNYLELKKSLLHQGHHFKSQTDTEVILHLYEEEGLEFLNKLNGMFAFALWDKTQKQLILARDRFGVKPLYFTVVNSVLLFASEVKAFLRYPQFCPKLNYAALVEHLAFQNNFQGRTLFENVFLLDAGHYLCLTAGNSQAPAPQKYWDLQFDIDENRSLDDFADDLYGRLTTAVNRQMISDRPVGSYLSGGMDSSSLVAVATQKVDSFHTFTCGFEIPENCTEDERYFDERELSRKVAQFFKTQHHELVIDGTVLPEILKKVVWHLDEPRVGISYQILLLCEEVEKTLPVILSGVGADELFGGYPWRYQACLNSPEKGFEAKYFPFATRLRNEGEIRRLLLPEAYRKANGFSLWDSFCEVNSPSQHNTILDRLFYFEFKGFLQGLLLVEDKLSMASGVETRVPFLDNEVVNLAENIPASYKFKLPGSYKIVLKKAMQGRLPETILKGRKQGFTPPDQTYYRTTFLPFIQETLLGSRCQNRGVFDPKEVKHILDEHIKGQRNHRFLIWSLLCIEYWFRLFVDNEER